MPDSTTLTLGSVVFVDFQIPDSIPWGGEQKVVTHKLLGDLRTIDATGRDDADLEWSGVFLGETALDDARALDAMRIGGQPQTLSWDELSYSVIVHSFRPEYRKGNYIPYKITCAVVSDLSAPPAGASDPTTDDMVSDDMDTCSGLVTTVNDPTLSGLFGTFQSAVSSVTAVTSIASASAAQLTSMLTPLSAVQGQVSSLLGTATAAVTDLPGFAGVQPGAPGPQNAAALVAAAQAMTSLDPLNQLTSYLGRIQTNVSAVGASGSEIPVAGGDLYTLAASEYGSPAGWTTIAQANGLTDPVLTGPQTIRIPPIAQPTDGVPNY